MKHVALICLLFACVVMLLPGCFPKQVAPPSERLAPSNSIDWSRVNLPATHEEGRWTLAEGGAYMLGLAFSQDGKTIYGYGSNSHLFLLKSTDGGHTWTTLPGLQQLEEEYDVWEVFFSKLVNDDLFLGSTGQGIFHSTDGGQSFEILPLIPGMEGQQAAMLQGVLAWRFDVTADSSGRLVILAGTVGCSEELFGGLWMLSYPYQNWVDMRVGNVDAGSKYNVWATAFSPNYAKDRQIVALMSDWEHVWVTFKNGDEGWAETIADAQIPKADTVCDFDKALSNLAFPEDYDSRNPVVFVGAGHFNEHLYQTPQYVDLYRIDGRSASKKYSTVTDLDIGGTDSSTPIYGIAVRGPAETATILAGSVGQVYRSSDGGKTWRVSTKPPTGGAIMYLAFEPVENRTVYCTSSDPGMDFVPSGYNVPVNEYGLSRSEDNGITWNQISMVGTTMGDVVGQAASPTYKNDKTIFMTSRSQNLLIAPFNLDQSLMITREPDKPGVTAKVIVISHTSIPPREQMRIDGEDYDAGNSVLVTLDDKHPSTTVYAPPISEQKYLKGQNDWVNNNYEWIIKNYKWWLGQWNDVYKQPRKALIYKLEGSVTVTTGEEIEPAISLDGKPDDWSGIKPLITDPQGDAASPDEDFKALYVASDSSFVYFMVEFYATKPSYGQILFDIDIDFDGVRDYLMELGPPDDKDLPNVAFLMIPNSSDPSHPQNIANSKNNASGQIAEFKFRLEDIKVDRFSIARINIVKISGQEFIHNRDSWLGSAEVSIKDVAIPVTIPKAVSPPLQFPSTESLWKTTDGGNTWERVLTSGLNVIAGNKQLKVGHLASIALSLDFAQDNTVFVYEGEDSSRVWVSANGGMSFAPYK